MFLCFWCAKLFEFHSIILCLRVKIWFRFKQRRWGTLIIHTNSHITLITLRQPIRVQYPCLLILMRPWMEVHIPPKDIHLSAYSVFEIKNFSKSADGSASKVNASMEHQASSDPVATASDGAIVGHGHLVGDNAQVRAQVGAYGFANGASETESRNNENIVKHNGENGNGPAESRVMGQQFEEATGINYYDFKIPLSYAHVLNFCSVVLFFVTQDVQDNGISCWLHCSLLFDHAFLLGDLSSLCIKECGPA